MRRRRAAQQTNKQTKEAAAPICWLLQRYYNVTHSPQRITAEISGNDKCIFNITKVKMKFRQTSQKVRSFFGVVLA
jgi:hypothetical protein